MLTLLLLAAAFQDHPNYEAVVAAPDSHQILLEDDKVRVLRVVIPAGETEPVHLHCWPSIMYFEQPQPITYISYQLENGAPVMIESKDAPAMPPALTVSIGPEGLHAIRNRGTEPFVAVRMEFKGEPCSAEDFEEN
ncbi:MAG: hypothetical protein CMN73_03235 [Sphingomonas sp.]|nr:hypothetical protein [Sphingomonas sp.]